MTQITALPVTGLRPSERPVATSVGSGATLAVTEGGVTREATVAQLMANAPSGTTNLAVGTITTTTVQVTSDTGNDATLPAATASAAGVATATQIAKLDAVAAGATANATDAQLRDRTTHTGQQPSSTISDFSASADARITAQKGVASGLASLDGTGKLATAQIPDSLTGNLNYQGTWNATTNVRSPQGGGIPAAAAGNKGHYYIVSVAGTTTIDAEADWGVHDWIVSNGAAWTKVDNSDSGSADAATIRATTLTGLDTGTATLPTAADSILSAFGKLVGWAGALATNVRAVVLTGFSTAVSTAVTAADSILQALGKLQAQVDLKEKLWVTQLVTGTSLTLAATDDRKTFIFSNAGAITVGVPTAASGIRCQFVWAAGTGTITVTPSSTTINGAGAGITLAQAAGAAELLPTGTANDWTLSGAIGDVVAADITDSTTAGRALLTAADAAAQRTALTAAARSQTFGFGAAFADGADETIVLDQYATFAYTIDSSVTQCNSGTATYRLQINGTNVGSTANAVSSTEQSQAHASANAVVVGDTVSLVRSANATCVMGRIKVNCTRTLA